MNNKSFAFNEGFDRYVDYEYGLCSNLDNPYSPEDERHSEFQKGMEAAFLVVD